MNFPISQKEINFIINQDLDYILNSSISKADKINCLKTNLENLRIFCEISTSNDDDFELENSYFKGLDCIEFVIKKIEFTISLIERECF